MLLLLRTTLVSFIYMSQASYEQIYRQLPQANTYLVSLRDTSATSIERQAGLLMNQSAVSSVVQNASAIRLFDSVASSLNQTHDHLGHRIGSVGYRYPLQSDQYQRS